MAALQRKRSVAVHARWAGLGHIQPFAKGSFVEVNFPRISLSVRRPSWRAVVLSGQQSVVGRAGTEELRSILETHPQDIQLFCIRIPAFSCLCSGFDGRLNGLGSFFFNRFDQSEFASSIYLGPAVRGDEFGMGNGLIQKDLII